MIQPFWASSAHTRSDMYHSPLSATVIAPPYSRLFDVNIRVIKAENGYIVEITSGSKLTTYIAEEVVQVRDIILAQVALAQLEK